LEEVKEQIRARHSRICKHKGIDPQTVEDEDTEKALTAKQYKKPFKGMCNTCGKQGHKSVDCWENERNKSNTSKKVQRGTYQCLVTVEPEIFTGTHCQTVSLGSNLG